MHKGIVSCDFRQRNVLFEIPSRFAAPDCLVLGTELEWNTGFMKFPAYRDGNLRGENKIHR